MAIFNSIALFRESLELEVPRTDFDSDVTMVADVCISILRSLETLGNSGDAIAISILLRDVLDGVHRTALINRSHPDGAFKASVAVLRMHLDGILRQLNKNGHSGRLGRTLNLRNGTPKKLRLHRKHIEAAYGSFVFSTRGIMFQDGRKRQGGSEKHHNLADVILVMIILCLAVAVIFRG